MTNQMYPWAITWNPVGGECPHKCSYCYVTGLKRFPGNKEKYSGPIRIWENELKGDPRKGRKGDVIFVCSMHDLFTAPFEVIDRVLGHCRKYPDNEYLFQTKAPNKMLEYIFCYGYDIFPPRTIIGTTIETNREGCSEAISPRERALWFGNINAIQYGWKKMVSIEPILDFDSCDLSKLIWIAKPDFVSIGADSKGHGMDEPDRDKTREFIKGLKRMGYEIKVKDNLYRIMGDGEI